MRKQGGCDCVGKKKHGTPPSLPPLELCLLVYLALALVLGTTSTITTLAHVVPVLNSPPKQPSRGLGYWSVLWGLQGGSVIGSLLMVLDRQVTRLRGAVASWSAS